ARARKTGRGDTGEYRSIADGLAAPVQFLGYTDAAASGVVAGLLVDGVAVPAATAGAAVEVVLDRTPFYAESGGQLSDTGTITTDDGAVVEVDDVQRPIPGLIVHRGRVVAG